MLGLPDVLLPFRNVGPRVAESSFILLGVVFSERDCLEAGLVVETFGVNGVLGLFPRFADALEGANGRLGFVLSYEGIFGLPLLAVNGAESFCETTRIMALLYYMGEGEFREKVDLRRRAYIL